MAIFQERQRMKSVLAILLTFQFFTIHAFFIHTASNQQRLHTLYETSSLKQLGDATNTHPKKAPIFITIGPPCSGKTDAVRNYLLAEGYDPDDVFTKDVDISLTSQSDVYHRIPIAQFLFPLTELSDGIGNQMLSSGCTVRDRLLDPAYDATDEEIRNVILRIAGRMTPQEFAQAIDRQALEAGDTKKFFKKRRIAVGKDLIQATEEVHLQAVSEVICSVHFQVPTVESGMAEELPYDIDDNEEDVQVTKDTNAADIPKVKLLSARELIKTPFVEIFVPQALFRGGIDKANKKFEQLLKEAPDDQPIVWGNTNTRPKEYAKALKTAEKVGRPVRFVAWGDSLPQVNRQELLRRNIARFRNSGKYIPAGAIAASLGRIEKLMNDAELEKEDFVQDWIRDEGSSSIDAALALLAGFQMTEGGFVFQIDEPRY
ncbi:hypothetical protein CTEN210_10302 [Chaetoceros tenuissimus]|uniref:Uncharacterized protein n=1 Tax=Chaetoceros tenuissimus TaxID=426638 RepID=A0AAD3CZ38_9STRA|nr:hypothetical protein CTEN210_10302 [Chaetoceros tenuissimus]